MATIGFSVGLGNIWRFPFVVGENGGGAFVLVYLIAVALIGVPLVIAEIMLGRAGGGSPAQSLANIASKAGASGTWRWLGYFTMATAFIIVSYYSVIGGWTLDYAARGLFGELGGADGAASAAAYASLLDDPVRLIIGQTAFLTLGMIVVARGLHGGIELATNIMMPMLFVILIGVVGYALIYGDAASGLSFMFSPDFSKITPRIVLAAVGQAFFSLGVGMAGMMMYGAYLDRSESIPSSAAIVGFADTLVAILAGIAIFPLVFAFDLPADGGPGLIFVTLPVAFAQMAGGPVVATLFFVLLVCAALTSCIAIIEPWMRWAEERTDLSRWQIAWRYGLLAWLLGLLTVFSLTNPESLTFAGRSVFDWFDYVTNMIMLPLGGLFIALATGWAVTSEFCARELGLSSDGMGFRAWHFALRYVIPAVVFAMMLAGVGG